MSHPLTLRNGHFSVHVKITTRNIKKWPYNYSIHALHYCILKIRLSAKYKQKFSKIINRTTSLKVTKQGLAHSEIDFSLQIISLLDYVKLDINFAKNNCRVKLFFFKKNIYHFGHSGVEQFFLNLLSRYFINICKIN